MSYVFVKVEFVNACRFRDFSVTLINYLLTYLLFGLAFSIPTFLVTPALTWTNRVLEVARMFTKHSKCCDKFFVLTMSLYAFISLLYKQLLQYTLLKSFTVPPALLTKFPKKLHMKLLASDIIFTKLSTKTLLL